MRFVAMFRKFSSNARLLQVTTLTGLCDIYLTRLPIYDLVIAHRVTILQVSGSISSSKFGCTHCVSYRQHVIWFGMCVVHSSKSVQRINLSQIVRELCVVPAKVTEQIAIGILSKFVDISRSRQVLRSQPQASPAVDDLRL